MITWRKSTHSGGGGADGQECVEVADLVNAVGVRDSKSPDAGHLALTSGAFADLVARVKRGDLSA